MSCSTREPNHFELAVFSLLWSEHCGYKHSARLLKRLPSTGERVLQGPGENAGVIDLGDGEAVAFKVESHNHPSAVEPFQGAATGVGGILRDIVAMGARPVALLDGLRFGAPDNHFDRAVAGIGAYGNSTGIPTVGGEAVFDESYADNCLVNAMCVGLLPAERLTTAKATGVGHLVVLYGATTGRDGIGGASVLASQELGENDADKRPSVQVGDPFTGKKLIEVSVELTERGLVESLQDCGAAGLASSLAEMASECGLDIHLDRVPLREEGMEPWEIMISESQERMVAVVRPQMLEALTEVCERWELHCTTIGEVTDSGLLRAFHGDEVVGAIPARLLTDECPRYDIPQQPRAARRPRRRRGARTTRRRCSTCSPRRTSAAAPGSTSATTTSSARAPCAGRASTPPSCACARRCAGSRSRSTARGGSRRSTRAPAARSRCSRRRGTSPAPAASRSALTDCLNFGNPEKPEIAWELAEAIEGIAAAAEALGIPVVSGNVSLYNDSDGRSIHPTPVVGCVGLVADVRSVPGAWQEGDVVLLAGEPELSFAGSEYQALYGELGGEPAPLDLAAEAALVRFLWKAAPLLTLAHDVSDGGLAVCLAEAALHSRDRRRARAARRPALALRRGRRLRGDRLPARGRRAARLEGRCAGSASSAATGSSASRSPSCGRPTA